MFNLEKRQYHAVWLVSKISIRMVSIAAIQIYTLETFDFYIVV